MRLVVAGGGDQRRGSGEAAPDETAFEEAPLREDARDATPGEEERTSSPTIDGSLACWWPARRGRTSCQIN